MGRERYIYYLERWDCCKEDSNAKGSTYIFSKVTYFQMVKQKVVTENQTTRGKDSVNERG